VAYNQDLADRIRTALAAQSLVREVRMFGGLSFMVNEAMVVSVTGDHALLVRVDPERTGELLEVKGARPAEMGAGRAMGEGWIAVSEEAISTDRELSFWLDAALGYNRAKTGKSGRVRQKRVTQ
jgi:hypothetical protein